MKKQDILFVTFENFPWKEHLTKDFDNLYVFDKKLKKSLDVFCNSLLKTNPKVIVGFAKSGKKYSTIEKHTINKFNNGMIEKDGVERFELYIPKEHSEKFKIRIEVRSSFCNYVMYKIKHFLKKNNKDIPFVFIHILKDDIKELSTIKF